ncbi:MAG: hypothetical protein QW273_03925 [Candidatus Pacearchaeota archaeon]
MGLIEKMKIVAGAGLVLAILVPPIMKEKEEKRQKELQERLQEKYIFKDRGIIGRVPGVYNTHIISLDVNGDNKYDILVINSEGIRYLENTYSKEKTNSLGEDYNLPIK